MTAPIEIPSQSQLYSNSPESPLIFNMSPFYPDRYCQCPHPAIRRPIESHYYSFPAIGSPASSSRSSISRSPSVRPHLTLSTPTTPHSYLPEQVTTSRGRTRTRPVSAASSRTSSTISSEPESCHSPEDGPLRLTPTTTITGFSPNSSAVAVASSKQTRVPKRGKLSPSPQRSESNSACAWVLSGTSSNYSGRTNRRSSTSTMKSTTSTDSCPDRMTDFKKFMLQRIEKERTFGPMRSMRSMRSLAAR
ncbi:hypothetical protein BDV98DRAFT_591985 [Pterulicium gracile]|uniref:Uncharacterized protein n=1 Tax=Pterulicium gracile TaxID=1884261 RepID=A0A5C3QPB4_9AGAR|nr:hypothetical protein BDV98DRAFT_591985 [Pterula gracilis]